MHPSDKDLLQEHPLFARLSGQVVWYLFEERGFAPEDIDGFMLRFEALKAETAALLRQVRGPDNRGGWLLLERAVDAASGAVCPACSRYSGACAPLDAPEILAFVPPFSLGCRLRGRVVSAADFERLAPRPVRRDLALPRPVSRLVCDNDWIFRRPWPAQDKLGPVD